MKKALLLLFLCQMGLLFNSCKKDPIGIWEDIIKLSQKSVHVPSEENSTIITTEGKWWWVTEIVFNNEKIPIDDTLNTFQDFLIEHAEFSIERKNTTTIIINMTENTTAQERNLHIGLEAGNYFDGINITQSKK